MALAIMIGVLGLQVWVWNSLAGRIEGGCMSKGQGALRFGLWALAPLALFVAGLASAVAIEESLKISVMSEGSDGRWR